MYTACGDDDYNEANILYSDSWIDIVDILCNCSGFPGLVVGNNNKIIFFLGILYNCGMHFLSHDFTINLNFDDDVSFQVLKI